MSPELDHLKEEAKTTRKWAVERTDWLENMSVQKRYAEDPMSLARRRDETEVMFRLADRLDTRVAAMESREKAA